MEYYRLREILCNAIKAYKFELEQQDYESESEEHAVLLNEFGMTEMEYKELKQIDIETVRDYIESIDLGDFGLDGVEIPTDEDCETVLERINKTGGKLEDIVDGYLIEVREVLDMGLEDEEEWED